jgi:hypothetical protein
MKTSIFNGLNASTLDFQFFSTIRVYPNNSNYAAEKWIIEYFNYSISNLIFAYSFENFKDGFKHTHLLSKVTDESTFISNLIDYMKPKNITNGDRIATVKVLKKEKDVNNGVPYKDVKITIKFWDIRNCKASIRVEKTFSPINSSLYLHKYTDRGFNFNYLFQQNKTN